MTSETAPAGLPTDREGRVALILDIVAQEAAIERSRLQPQARIAELEIASLDMVQAIFALESRFGIEIPVVAERGGAEFETVGDLVDHVLAAIDRAAA